MVSELACVLRKKDVANVVRTRTVAFPDKVKIRTTALTTTEVPVKVNSVSFCELLSLYSVVLRM